MAELKVLKSGKEICTIDFLGMQLIIYFGYLKLDVPNIRVNQRNSKSALVHIERELGLLSVYCTIYRVSVGTVY